MRLLSVAVATAASAIGIWLYIRRRQRQSATLRVISARGQMTDCASSAVDVVEPRNLGCTPVPTTVVGELAGCLGLPVSALVPAHVADGLPNPHVIFTSSDGKKINPVPLEEASSGIIVHSAANGSPLPSSRGGPLRVWCPDVDVKQLASVTICSVDSAAVVLFDGSGRALILQRGPTAPWMPLKWNLPGGGIDAGETALDAAVREAQEETGLTPLEPQQLGHYEYAPGRVLAVYATRWRAGRLAINWESCGHAWVDANESESYDYVPSVREVLRSAFAMRASGGLN